MHSRSDKHNQYLPRINGKILTSTRLCGRVEAGLLFITPQIIPHFSPLVNTFFKKIFPLFFTPPRSRTPLPALPAPRSSRFPLLTLPAPALPALPAPHSSHSSLFPPPALPALPLPTPPHSPHPPPRSLFPLRQNFPQIYYDKIRQFSTLY